MLGILLDLILLEVWKGIVFGLVVYFALTKPILKTIWELQERTETEEAEEGEVAFNEDKPQIGFRA